MRKSPLTKGFHHHEMTEEEFDKLPLEKRELIQKHGIPIVPEHPTGRAFKMVPFYYNKLFPENNDD